MRRCRRSTAAILTKDIEYLKERTGIDFYLKYIVDINFSHAEKLSLDSSLFTNDLDSVLADPEVCVVVELMGGITTARDFSKKILKAGKNIVTANKALLAHYGVELLSLARENNVSNII